MFFETPEKGALILGRLARLPVLAGLHPVRIEFFWRPPEGVSVTVQRPPGIKARLGEKREDKNGINGTKK